MTNNSKATEDEVKKPQTFELPERIDLPTQTGEFLSAYPEMRRGWDSNPRYRLDIPVFETSALDHYATSPRRARRDSNLQPLDPQSNALSIKLRALNWYCTITEPTTRFFKING